MDWIPALLKHLGLSRSVIAAVFITALTLHVGPRVAPAYVDSVPKEWSAVVVGSLVFSAALLLLWALSSLCSVLNRRWKRATAALASFNLSQEEVNLLYAMGELPRESLNFEHINYDQLGMTRLEVLELVHGLQRKGLVSINHFNSALFALSATGRQRALEIQRNSKRDATQ
jgi:hypothetical protein